VSRRSLALAAGLVALYALAVGSLAARAPLWNDELYTWYFAQLPTMADVWDKLGTGVEQSARQVPHFLAKFLAMLLVLRGRK